MNPYILANQLAWNKLAKDHYYEFKRRYSLKDNLLNPNIIKELGDIKGKSLIHLQCNTGADTLSLSRLGAKCSGVDLAPDNIVYAYKLFEDFNTEGTFYQADLMEFGDNHDKKYDIVFTSEGAIGWLPDFKIWAQTIKKLLNPGGFFYIYEIHPFFLMFDEDLLAKEQLAIKYPYFGRKYDKSETIGGYAAEEREGECYYWMYSVSDVVSALAEAGLKIEFFHEFDELCYKIDSMIKTDTGDYYFPKWKGSMPLMFSIKATLIE